MQLLYLIITGIVLQICYAGDDGTGESDGDTSRKILGSSVVTSVSVVMDTANKKHTIFTDAIGRPQSKPSNPSELASPIDLLNPDRYEFYTFDDHGDLVKRLMSLEEIRSIIATGDGDVLDLDSFTSQDFLPEKRVSDVVTNVQSVVKDEMEVLKDSLTKPMFDTPDVSDSWSMILPAVFGNSGEDIKPERPIGFVTPDTIMLEPSSAASTRRPVTLSTPIYYSSSSPLLTTRSATEPAINVQIIANSEAEGPGAADHVALQTSEAPTRSTVPPRTSAALVRTSTATQQAPPTTTPSPPSTSSTSTTLQPITSTKEPTKTTSALKPLPNIFGLPPLETFRPPTTSTHPPRPTHNIFGLPLTSSTLPPLSSTPPQNKTEYPTQATTWRPTPGLFSAFKEMLAQTTTHMEPEEATTTTNWETTELPTTTEQETKMPPLLSALDEAQKLSASEMLNNLLWTTNIYEINTELAAAQPNASLVEPDQRFDTSDSASEVQTTTLEGLETSTQSPSETSFSTLTPVSNDVGLAATTEDGELTEAAPTEEEGTDLSRQEDIELGTSTTTELPTSSPLEAASNLNSSVEQLLAQVNNQPAALSGFQFTEAQSASTQQQQETTTYYYVVMTKSKPAKADLSLEQAIIAEEMKNASLVQLEVATETIQNSSEAPTSTQEESEATTTEGFTTEGSTQEIATKTIPKPSIVITVNPNGTLVTESGHLVANHSLSNPNWTLVSTVAPQQALNLPPPTLPYPEAVAPNPVDLEAKPMQGFGLEESTASLDVDVHQFIQLCNELAFGFWKTVTTGLSSARSVFVSPFAATSMLAMVFLGAKGSTSEEMNEILKLDDMVTFNPHLTFKGVSESLTSEPGSGVATTAIIRELFSDRSKGKLLDFYKNRVRAFYDGFVEEVGYREIGDVIRRRSNLLVKKLTNGKYPQFFGDASITARPPLSGVSINIFETDCSQTATEGRDGELHFIVFPSIKQRRLVPVPAVVYKAGFLAGYEPSLDATAVSIGGKDQVVSTILVIPGQQGIAAPGDGLARLEKRLVESSFKKGAWSRLLRSLIPRPGLEVQIPRFSHKSVINATHTLQRMGLHQLFNPATADLRGLNGVANELHLSDVLQVNQFATCGEKRSEDAHHSEVYPATTVRARSARRLDYIPIGEQDEPRDYQRAFHDPLHDPSLLKLPLNLRPRQARIPEVPRLRFDRPFLYFVRHNPTGLILHMGRFNPRLLP
ncbi:uncharacterized protein PB18E9.04c [Dendroctonus ponderosae]|nr:uncharacterized protein PB18E9.04c [Dendroctonus ponderosae]KAH1028902.1 hypothetical protein HUJ05_002221 [Dendroctonus ponderosae]